MNNDTAHTPVFHMSHPASSWAELSIEPDMSGIDIPEVFAVDIDMSMAIHDIHDRPLDEDHARLVVAEVWRDQMSACAKDGAHGFELLRESAKNPRCPLCGHTMSAGWTDAVFRVECTHHTHEPIPGEPDLETVSYALIDIQIIDPDNLDGFDESGDVYISAHTTRVARELTHRVIERCAEAIRASVADEDD